mgnify:CR=1 FL=1
MKRKLVVGLGKALGVFAVLFVTTACVFIMHRPEIPEELRK